VIPALIRRFHEAKVSNAPEVVIWGTGTPRREFLHVDDMAAASTFVMGLEKEIYDKHVEPMQSHINVGFGSDVTIAELAKSVSNVVGFVGKISFDVSKLDGSPRKWMDSGKLASLGWVARIELGHGLKNSYYDFQKNHSKK
jgi:GDP-L-fucose synthase